MVCHYQFLDQLKPAEREHLLLHGRQISIPTNHQLLFQSDWGSEAFVISAGIAKARSLCLDGSEVVISLMGAGALIGDLALLSPQPVRSLDVVALTPLSLLKLRSGAVQEAMEGNPQVMHAIACLQAQRLIALGHRLMLMREDATTRLLSTLLDLARLNGAKDDPKQPIPAIPQQEIATIAGLSRGTTSTLITKLRSQGTLAVNDQGELRFATLVPLERRRLL
jgi:CRP/FNR family cyclic AMP-dependent transcriptional regulator